MFKKSYCCIQLTNRMGIPIVKLEARGAPGLYYDVVSHLTVTDRTYELRWNGNKEESCVLNELYPEDDLRDVPNHLKPRFFSGGGCSGN